MIDAENDGEGSVWGYMAAAPGAPKKLRALLGDEGYAAWLAGLPQWIRDSATLWWFEALDKLREVEG